MQLLLSNLVVLPFLRDVVTLKSCKLGGEVRRLEQEIKKNWTMSIVVSYAVLVQKQALFPCEVSRIFTTLPGKRFG